MKEEKKDLFPSCIPEIERIIGYTFRDKSLLTQAFTRTSFCNEHGKEYQSNEVLEFIGDSVLSVAIITFLTEMHAQRYRHGIKTVFGEGDFSNIKSKLSDKKNLSECITAIGLEKYLRLGEGDKKLGIEKEPSVKEDLFESIIGATYIDCERDISTVMKVVSKMLDVSAYAAKTPPAQSSKNALQEYCADKKRKLPQPIYKTLGEEGPDHKKTYERGVYIGERLVASAKGKNLKIADAGAAEAALKILLSEDAASEGSAANQSQEPKANAKSTPAEPRVNTGKAASTPRASVKKASTEPKAVNTNKASTEKPTPKKDEGKASKKQPQKQRADKKQTIVGNSAPQKTERKATQAAPSTAEKVTRGGTSAAVTLKKHATGAKVATPTFKDLGEAREGGKSVYRVECIFMGKSVIGVGDSRPSAKENAAAKMLSTLKPTPSKSKRNKSLPKAKTVADGQPKSKKSTKGGSSRVARRGKK
ncbi:MAG: hypothetical protein IJF05_03415 [Clostridia bacterium]|nr:hypothetical protein [Clostridia bacterium]